MCTTPTACDPFMAILQKFPSLTSIPTSQGCAYQTVRPAPQPHHWPACSCRSPLPAFGLKNAAQSFKQFMYQVLHGLPFVYSYLDDILITSPTSEEHRDNLCQVFSCLRTMVSTSIPANVSWAHLHSTSLVSMWTARESTLWKTRYKPSGTFLCHSHSVS